jgi:hypothetical protein
MNERQEHGPLGHQELREIQEQHMKLVNMANEFDSFFIHYLFGWMGVERHKDMAECARAYLNDQYGTQRFGDKGRALLAKFDEENNLSKKSVDVIK